MADHVAIRPPPEEPLSRYRRLTSALLLRLDRNSFSLPARMPKHDPLTGFFHYRFMVAWLPLLLPLLHDGVIRYINKTLYK